MESLQESLLHHQGGDAVQCGRKPGPCTTNDGQFPQELLRLSFRNSALCRSWHTSNAGAANTQSTELGEHAVLGNLCPPDSAEVALVAGQFHPSCKRSSSAAFHSSVMCAGGFEIAGTAFIVSFLIMSIVISFTPIAIKP